MVKTDHLQPGTKFSPIGCTKKIFIFPKLINRDILKKQINFPIQYLRYRYLYFEERRNIPLQPLETVEENGVVENTAENPSVVTSNNSPPPIYTKFENENTPDDKDEDHRNLEPVV